MFRTRKINSKSSAIELNDNRWFFVICIVGERRIKCHLHEIAKLLANMYTNMYGFIFKRFVYIFHIDVISMCQCPNKLEEKQTCFSRMISYTISFYPWCMDLFLILTTLKCLFHFSFHLFAYNCFCSFSDSVHPIWLLLLLLAVFHFLFVWFSRNSSFVVVNVLKAGFGSCYNTNCERKDTILPWSFRWKSHTVFQVQSDFRYIQI